MRTWQRLEPQTTDQTLESGIRASVYDPLWMVCRQWQWGEFSGEDTGSPVSTQLKIESNRLTRFSSHAVPATSTQQYDPRHSPLEAVAERELTNDDMLRTTPAGIRASMAFEGATRQSIDAGLGLFRLLRRYRLPQTVFNTLLTRYPVSLSSDASVADARASRYLNVMAGRAPNGYKIWLALRQAAANNSTAALLSELGIVNPQTALLESLQTWQAEYGALPLDPGMRFTSRATAWVPDRMEYAFSVAAPNGSVSTENADETALLASSYRGGTLDWYTFERSPETALPLGSAIDNRQPLFIKASIPSPVNFPGMPLDRWWTFENANFDVSLLDTAPEDLVRLVFAEFSIGFSNNWFVLPVDLEVGTLTRLHSVKVMTTFGEELPLSRHMQPGFSSHGEAQKGASWRMYELSGEPENNPPFFLCPALPPSLQSPPIEEVRFIRDEIANLIWGIERIAPSPITGNTVDRYEQYQEQRRLSEQINQNSHPAQAPIAYRLGTAIPDYWIPLVPRQHSNNLSSIDFERGSLLNTENGHNGRAFGALLEEISTLYGEEISYTGFIVTRSHQLASWSDGSTYHWLGRQKVTGRGEGSSGLAFDTIEHTEFEEEKSLNKTDTEGTLSIRDISNYVDNVTTTPQLSIRDLISKAAHEESQDNLITSEGSIWRALYTLLTTK